MIGLAENHALRFGKTAAKNPIDDSGDPHPQQPGGHSRHRARLPRSHPAKQAQAELIAGPDAARPLAGRETGFSPCSARVALPLRLSWPRWIFEGELQFLPRCAPMWKCLRSVELGRRCRRRFARSSPGSARGLLLILCSERRRTFTHRFPRRNFPSSFRNKVPGVRRQAEPPRAPCRTDAARLQQVSMECLRNTVSFTDRAVRAIITSNDAQDRLDLVPRYQIGVAAVRSRNSFFVRAADPMDGSSVPAPRSRHGHFRRARRPARRRMPR